jgi:hypothetical protein
LWAAAGRAAPAESGSGYWTTLEGGVNAGAIRPPVSSLTLPPIITAKGDIMKTQYAAVALILVLAGFAHGAEEGQYSDSKAQEIIANKCTVCHGEARIKAAFTAGKDMRLIQKDMQGRGANLSGNEQDVLGIYWKHSPQVK